jgi:hypothetical protein
MPTATPPPELADGPAVAVSRERFLSGEPVQPAPPPGVRGPILASWRRSRDWRVAADRVEPRYVRDPDADTPLTRGAEPVLRSLREQLDGQPVSILLTDAAGLVLARLTADAGLERHLDRVQLSPGFSYAERYVGTNGIGTALEGGRPMHVFGHEHYAEHLEDLACAAVPIAHPVSGKTVGVMNLTCWRRDAGSLLLTLAKSTAAQIRQGLLAETGTRELALFQEYLRACRRSPGIVLALDTDVAMVNDRARAVLDPADQAALLRHGAEALATGRAIRREVPLPTGGAARMTLRPLAGGGGVVRVELLACGPAAGAAADPFAWRCAASSRVRSVQRPLRDPNRPRPPTGVADRPFRGDPAGRPGRVEGSAAEAAGPRRADPGRRPQHPQRQPAQHHEPPRRALTRCAPTHERVWVTLRK